MNRMKSFFIILLAVVFLAGTTGLEAAKKKQVEKLKFPPLNKIQKPEIKKAVTSNGIKLRLIKNEKLPLIDLRILVKGGNAYDPPNKIDLTTITAQLLRIGGTKELKPGDLDKLLDSKGITIDVNAGNDYFTVTLSCLKENFDEAVSILAKILREPAFDSEKMEELKAQLSSAISRRNDSPAPINNREFTRLIYGEQLPFAAVLEYEHLDNITTADVTRAYNQFFAPGNMLAGVTGPLEIDEIKSAFEKYFGD